MKIHWGTTYSYIIILVSYIIYEHWNRYSDHKKQKWQFSTTPLWFDARYPANPYLYPHKVQSLRYISAAGSIYLHSNFSDGLRKANQRPRTYWRQNQLRLFVASRVDGVDRVDKIDRAVDFVTSVYDVTEWIIALQGHPRSSILVPLESAY